MTPMTKWENELDRAFAVQCRLAEWRALSDAGMRLRAGELTIQEIRTIRAVLKAIGEKPKP